MDDKFIKTLVALLIKSTEELSIISWVYDPIDQKLLVKIRCEDGEVDIYSFEAAFQGNAENNLPRNYDVLKD